MALYSIDAFIESCAVVVDHAPHRTQSRPRCCAGDEIVYSFVYSAVSEVIMKKVEICELIERELGLNHRNSIWYRSNS